MSINECLQARDGSIIIYSRQMGWGKRLRCYGIRGMAILSTNSRLSGLGGMLHWRGLRDMGLRNLLDHSVASDERMHGVPSKVVHRSKA
jgi:hypothetical protein